MKTLDTPNRPRDPLTEIDDFDEEVRLVRDNAELMAFLKARSGGSKTLTEAELRKRLGLRQTTRARKRRSQASPTR
jgi:hypothetical protein